MKRTFGVCLMLMVLCCAVHSEGSNEQALLDLQLLSSDQMAGRKPGTAGHQKAADYIAMRFQQLNLQPLAANYTQKFEYSVGFSERLGQNIIGLMPGERHEHYIVVTAHYDHLGSRSGRIYNGADDNATGVAAMLALAHYFRQNKPTHSMIFLATDAEEDGLRGARAFLKAPLLDKTKIVMNINLDMLGNPGHRRTLFVLGARRPPVVKQMVLATAELLASSDFRLKLRPGKGARLLSQRSGGQVDWLRASDHWPFIQNNIPYLYFGVDVHKHYHKATDDFEQINQTFFLQAINAVVQISRQLDELELKKLID